MTWSKWIILNHLPPVKSQSIKSISMGSCCVKQELTDEDIHFLKKHTRYDEETIREWYAGFLQVHAIGKRGVCFAWILKTEWNTFPHFFAHKKLLDMLLPQNIGCQYVFWSSGLRLTPLYSAFSKCSFFSILDVYNISNEQCDIDEYMNFWGVCLLANTMFPKVLMPICNADQYAPGLS